jgi:tRNA(Ile)-lysidine synthetase-like protein
MKGRPVPPKSEMLLEAVQASLKRAGLAPKDCLVAGLSGGVDSQTLVHALVELRDRGTGPVIRAVHVDHQLRAESARDAKECQRVAAMMRLPLEIVRVDVGDWDHGTGIEAAARDARFAALAAKAREYDTEWVALGHTLDDQAETVLLRLARGTSLDGLTGMRPVTSRDISIDPQGTSTRTVRLLRPLLEQRRSDIEAYASEQGLIAIEDPSNADPRFRRNAIRHRLLPKLEAIVPGAIESIARASHLLDEDAALLAALAAEACDNVVERLGQCMTMDRGAFRLLPVPLQRRVLVITLHALSRRVDLTGERLDALLRLAVDGSPGRVVEMGGGLSALIDYERLIIGPAAEIVPTLRATSGLPLLDPPAAVPINGSRRINLTGGWCLDVQTRDEIDRWELRTRRSGDRVVSPGYTPVKLQDWFVDRKIPRYLRDVIPLLVRNGTVYWVVGLSPAPFKDVDSQVTARLTQPTTKEHSNDQHAARRPPA